MYSSEGQAYLSTMTQSSSGLLTHCNLLYMLARDYFDMAFPYFHPKFPTRSPNIPESLKAKLYATLTSTTQNICFQAHKQVETFWVNSKPYESKSTLKKEKQQLGWNLFFLTKCP